MQRFQKRKAIVNQLFPQAGQPLQGKKGDPAKASKPQVEDREAQKIRRYEEMFRKQEEMEAKKLKRK